MEENQSETSQSESLNINTAPETTSVHPTSVLTESPSQISIQKPYAKIAIRFAAMIIDTLIIAILIFMPLILLLSQLHLDSAVGNNSTASDIGMAIIVLAYGVLLTKRYGGTPGKRFFKMKVVDVDGKSLSWGKVIIRETIGKIVSGWILMLGYIWALFNKKKTNMA